MIRRVDMLYCPLLLITLALSNTMNRDEHLMRTRTILKFDEICLLAKSRFLPVFPLLATGAVCCSKQVPFQSLGKWNTLKTVASSKCQSCATGITQGRIMVPCPVGIVASLP